MDHGGRSSSALEIIPDASTVYYEPVMNDQSIWANRVDYRTWRGKTSKASKDGGRSGSAIEIIPDASAVYHESVMNDQSIWATEEDYRAWSGDTSMDGRQSPSQSQSRAESEHPPSKKPRGYSVGDSGPSSKSKALGKMFFKTKLCCMFRAGTCPYITDCYFAHGMEELRNQEIVAAHEEDSLLEPREEHKIPVLTSPAPAVDGHRSHKGRHCKRFYTEEGCPYGDVCTFLHDERFKARERAAISLSPSDGGGGSASEASGLNQKPSNWKTRICKKWGKTGSCSFGSKCHFAHGSTELHRHGGGLVEMEARDASVAMDDPKQSGASSMTVIADAVVAPNTSVPHAEVPGQRSTVDDPKQSGASSMTVIADAVVAPNTSVPHSEVPGQRSTVDDPKQSGASSMTVIADAVVAPNTSVPHAEVPGQRSSVDDPKQSGESSMTVIADAVVAPNTSVPHAEVPGQRSTVVNQRQVQRPLQKWEGTDKISQFYADLIDDNE